MWHFSDLKLGFRMQMGGNQMKDGGRTAGEGVREAAEWRTAGQRNGINMWLNGAIVRRGKLLVCFLWQCADCSVVQQRSLSLIGIEWSETKWVFISCALAFLFTYVIVLVREQTHMHMLHKIDGSFEYIFILNYTMFLWQFSRKPQFWCWC